jgi:hypothetical protein
MYNGPWTGEITRMYNSPGVGEITLDEDASQLRSEQALSELGAWAAEHLGTSR